MQIKYHYLWIYQMKSKPCGLIGIKKRYANQAHKLTRHAILVKGATLHPDEEDPDTRVLGHAPRDGPVHVTQYLNSQLWHQGKEGKFSMGHSVAVCLDLCLRPWGQASVHLRSPKPLFWPPKGLFHASLSTLSLSLQCGLFEPHSLANPFEFCNLHIIL